ncbi:MAG: MBL fold metallo-hydrolase [Anaerolineae bacterium]|nr:MBL fold metallo-hydrolase [Anaerolineae bacterium]
MELTWYGLGCFRIVERGYPTIVTDPYVAEDVGGVLPRGRTDIVLSSILLDEPEKIHWPGLRNVSRTIAGPGEYEMGGVFVTGIASFKDRKRGADSGQNVIYSINVNGVVICHLGELGHTPTQAQVEAMGAVNVLLIPVGLADGLSPAMASEIVSLVEPDIVIPMNYHVPGIQAARQPVARFLKEMGVAHGETVESLKLSSGQTSEETQVMLLEVQK